MFVLLNWQEVWGWPLPPLNLLGKMCIGRERSSSWVFTVDSFPPTCSWVRGIAAFLHTQCLLCCGGEKDSISGWPNDKVLSLKIPPLSLIIPLSATMGSGHSLANATWTLNTLSIQTQAYLLHKPTYHPHRRCCHNIYWYFLIQKY